MGLEQEASKMTRSGHIGLAIKPLQGEEGGPSGLEGAVEMDIASEEERVSEETDTGVVGKVREDAFDVGRK